VISLPLPAIPPRPGRMPSLGLRLQQSVGWRACSEGRLTAATLETVTFDRPHRIAFRLVRGPVPHITEEFALTEQDGTTRLEYSGELGTDFAVAGQWWADRVAMRD
jgi:hypothetical protein